MTSNQNEEKGKIFVGGLSWDTTQESLKNYFCKFGEVTECVVVMNPTTGKSRGFGFVKFADPACIETVQAAGPHILDGKQIDPNGCNRKKTGKSGKGSESGKRKLFVGGLPANIDEGQLRDGFTKYGKVHEVTIVYDQLKQRPRGFGFVTFESEDTVDKIVRERFIQINGKQVECKRAEPREATNNDPSSLLSTIANGAAVMVTLNSDGSLALVPTPSQAGGNDASHLTAALHQYPHQQAKLLQTTAASGYTPQQLMLSQVAAAQQAAAGGYVIQNIGGQNVLVPAAHMLGAATHGMGAGAGGYIVQGPNGTSYLVQSPHGMSGLVAAQPDLAQLTQQSYLNAALSNGFYKTMDPNAAGDATNNTASVLSPYQLGASAAAAGSLVASPSMATAGRLAAVGAGGLGYYLLPTGAGPATAGSLYGGQLLASGGHQQLTSLGGPIASSLATNTHPYHHHPYKR